MLLTCQIFPGMKSKEGGGEVCTYVGVLHAHTVQCLAVISTDDLGGLYIIHTCSVWL